MFQFVYIVQYFITCAIPHIHLCLDVLKVEVSDSEFLWDNFSKKFMTRWVDCDWVLLDRNAFLQSGPCLSGNQIVLWFKCCLQCSSIELLLMAISGGFLLKPSYLSPQHAASSNRDCHTTSNLGK